eukprot:g2198.t1
MMRLLLSFLFGALTLLVDRTVIIVVNGADIVVNGANGEHIVTVENVDLSEMTACDLQMRVFSARDPVAARQLPHWVTDSNLSLTLGTVCVGIHDCLVPEEEEYRRIEQSRRAQGQIEIKRYQTVAEAFKLPRRRLLGKQAAGRLWRGPDRLVLTAVCDTELLQAREALGMELLGWIQGPDVPLAAIVPLVILSNTVNR